MRHIRFTHVDAVTGVPVTIAPAAFGPAFPAGALFGFALESRYPTATPIFYGTTEDDADRPGILSAVTPAEYEAARTAEMAAREALRAAAEVDVIDAEKTRRIVAGFAFQGRVIQSRAEDRENLAGAKSAAQDAIFLGAEPGEFGWMRRLDAAAPETFAWITADNSLLPLDAQDMVSMGYAAMLHKQGLIFAGKALKDRALAGETIGNVGDDAHWP